MFGHLTRAPLAAGPRDLTHISRVLVGTVFTKPDTTRYERTTYFFSQSRFYFF
jgi:hypothetical protein